MTESLLLDISAVPNFSRLLNNAFTNLLSGDSPYIATHALRVDFFHILIMSLFLHPNASSFHTSRVHILET